MHTGTTAYTLLKEFVEKNLSRCKGKPTKWKTLGGNFLTKRKALVNFKLPEISTSCTINAVAHVDESTVSSKAQCDMIVGTDSLNELGIDFSLSKKTIIWDDVVLPMKKCGAVSHEVKQKTGTMRLLSRCMQR